MKLFVRYLRTAYECMCSCHDLAVLPVQVFVYNQNLHNAINETDGRECNVGVLFGVVTILSLYRRTSCTVYAVLLYHFPMGLLDKYRYWFRTIWK